MTTGIESKDVLKVAKLAKLQLTEEEVKRLGDELSLRLLAMSINSHRSTRRTLLLSTTFWTSPMPSEMTP